MSEKILGYILLALGIMIIIYSAISVYMVFTKQSRPVELFDLPAVSLNANQLLSGALPPEAQGLLQQSSGTKAELVSAELLNETSNIFAHLMLMGFLASIGAKLASLGTQLVRPIVVHLKAKEVETNSP